MSTHVNANMSDSIKDLTAIVMAFSAARGWQQRPNEQKDLAISISMEAAELLEHFQWVKDEQIAARVAERREDIADEVSDVVIYALQLAAHCDIDLGAAIVRKMEKNAEKYPVKV